MLPEQTTMKNVIFLDHRAQAHVSVVIYLFSHIYWCKSWDATPLSHMSPQIKGLVSHTRCQRALGCYAPCRLFTPFAATRWSNIHRGCQELLRFSKLFPRAWALRGWGCMTAFIPLQGSAQRMHTVLFCDECSSHAGAWSWRAGGGRVAVDW